jgi:hypothetical protein
LVAAMRRLRESGDGDEDGERRRENGDLFFFFSFFFDTTKMERFMTSLVLGLLCARRLNRLGFVFSKTGSGRYSFPDQLIFV